MYYGQKEDVNFVPVAKGLWKLDFPWHLTPFHHVCSSDAVVPEQPLYMTYRRVILVPVQLYLTRLLASRQLVCVPDNEDHLI